MLYYIYNDVFFVVTNEKKTFTYRTNLNREEHYYILSLFNLSLYINITYFGIKILK